MLKFNTGQFDRSAIEICLGDVVYAPFSRRTFRVDFGTYIWEDYEHTGFFLRDVNDDNYIEPLGYSRTSLDILTEL